MREFNVTDLAINKALGIRLAPPEGAHILELPERSALDSSEGLLLNHLGTVHASVQFALAEAASGAFLLRELGEQGVTAGESPGREQVFAVLRSSAVKFRKPAPAGFGMLHATARFAETPGPRSDAAQLSASLTSRGRALVAIHVEVAIAHGEVTMTGAFDWFLQRQGDQV